MRKLFALFLLVVSCSSTTGNLESRRSTDLEARRVRRIAVLPPGETYGAAAPKMPFSTSPDATTGEREAPANLAQHVYNTMAALPNWQIVSESEVREASQALPAGGDAARLKRIGESVYADAVLISRLERYRERVGDQWGAKSPASVAFILNLVDVRRGDVIWTAHYDETQKSLSDNIFALGEISQRGFRWLTADQLIQDGVKKAIVQLHQLIGQRPTS